MALYAAISVLLFGGAVALVARAVALPAVRASARLGRVDAYGFRDQAPEAEESRAGSLEEFAKRVGDVMARHITSVSDEDMRRELMAAGMYRTSPRTLLGYRVLGAALLPGLVGWASMSTQPPPLV